MLARLLALLGVILIVLGVLKLVGLLAIGSASAGLLIVVGIIVVLVAEYVLGGAFLNRPNRL